MNQLILPLALVAASILATGCEHIQGGTHLQGTIDATQLTNITTGDGTFENYTAVGHYTATEIGIGFGIPGVTTLLELYPAVSNEMQLQILAQEAQHDEADAIINLKPVKNLFTGVPFIIFGVYIDRIEGTGIETKNP